MTQRNLDQRTDRPAPGSSAGDAAHLRIGIPTEGGRLCGHFGGARQFAFVDVDPVTRKILRVEMAGTPEHQPGVFPRWLAGQGVHTVIAGGIGHRALSLMGQLGIRVRAGLADATVEDLVAALMDGRLSGSPTGCDHHGHDHEHGNGQEHAHEHGHGHGCGHGHGHTRAPGL